jgi:hypothetical protein
MKLHKITVYLADVNNDSTLKDCQIEIENGVSDYFIKWFGKCESKEIGEWGDNHPLNKTKINMDKEWDKLK